MGLYSRTVVDPADDDVAQRRHEALEHHRATTARSRSSATVPADMTLVCGWAEDIPDNQYL